MRFYGSDGCGGFKGKELPRPSYSYWNYVPTGEAKEERKRRSCERKMTNRLLEKEKKRQGL